MNNNNNDREPEIILRSYSTVWKYEKKLYAIDRYRLWVPMVLNDILFFAVGLVIVVLLSNIPIFAKIPFLIRYGLIPFGIMKFLTKKKFDGKLPHKFLLGYLEYLILPKAFSRFSETKEYSAGKFSPVPFRAAELYNKIDIAVTANNRGGRRKR